MSHDLLEGFSEGYGFIVQLRQAAYSNDREMADGFNSLYTQWFRKNEEHRNSDTIANMDRARNNYMNSFGEIVEGAPMTRQDWLKKGDGYFSKIPKPEGWL